MHPPSEQQVIESINKTIADMRHEYRISIINMVVSGCFGIFCASSSYTSEEFYVREVVTLIMGAYLMFSAYCMSLHADGLSIKIGMAENIVNGSQQ